MPMIEETNLQLNLIADDKATSTIKALSGLVGSLAKDFKSLGDMNPFAKMQDDADALLSTLKDVLDYTTKIKTAFSDMATSSKNPFKPWADTLSTLMDDSDALSQNIKDIQGETKTNPMSKWQDSMSAMSDSASTISDKISLIQKDAGGKSPFESWDSSLAGASTNISDIYAKLQDIVKLAAKPIDITVTQNNVGSGGGGRSSGGGSGTPTVKKPSSAQIKSWFENLDPNNLPADAKSSWAQIYFNGMSQSDVSDFYGKYGNELGGPQPTVIPPKQPRPPKLPSVTGVLGKADSLLNEIPMKLLTSGMNAMLGGYMLNSIASSSGNLAYIQQIAQQNNLGSNTAGLNRASQIYALLGSQGLTGQAGMQTLDTLHNTLYNAFFTKTGQSSGERLKLQNLGITQAMVTESPWESLTSIAHQYNTLMNKNPTQASTLLSQLGIQNLAPLLGNWSTMNQSVSSLKLGMSPSELSKAVKNDQTFQLNMQKLSISFSQMATALVPAATRIVKGLTDIANVVSGKVSIGQGLQAFGKDVGAVGTAIVGVVAAIKVAKLGSEVATFVKNVTALGKAASSAEGGLAGLIAWLRKTSSSPGGGGGNGNTIVPGGHGKKGGGKGGGTEETPPPETPPVSGGLGGGVAVGITPEQAKAQSARIARDDYAAGKLSLAAYLKIMKESGANPYPLPKVHKSTPSPSTQQVISNSSNNTHLGMPPVTSTSNGSPGMYGPALSYGTPGAGTNGAVHTFNVNVNATGATTIDKKTAKIIGDYVSGQITNAIRARANIDLAV